MTRENKIGLLVGLAFIIAVGILISNYLSNADEPTTDHLQHAGQAVRSSLGEVAENDGDTAPPVVRVPAAVTPARPVPTAGELAARTRAAARAPAPVAPIQTDTDSIPPTALAAVPTDVAAVPPGLNANLLDLARKAGQQLVAPADDPAMPTPAVVARHATARTVEAASGDTLGTLAERAYGSNTKATRDALVAANPSLRKGAVAGRTYAVTAARSAAAADPPQAAKAAVAPPAVWYTVQPGDTLWSIASNEVGTHGAVAAIEDLNRDVLHGSDRVHARMRLRLPKHRAAAGD